MTNTEQIPYTKSIPCDQYGRVSGREVANLLSRMANSGTQDDAVLFAEAISTEHRTLQQGMVATMLTAQRLMAECGTDARNEAAVAICQKIRALLDAEGVFVDSCDVVRLPFV